MKIANAYISPMQSELQWTSLVKKYYHKDHYISNQHSTQEIFNMSSHYYIILGESKLARL